jgi:hypothetical protein
VRVLVYDDKTGADLWENKPVWIRLKSVGSGSWTGVVTISEIKAKGFRKGDSIQFTPDRVFDVYETSKDGLPLANRGKAAFIRGKDVLVGITYLNGDGTLNRRAQLHGKIEVVSNRSGIGIRVPGRRALFTLPPDLRSIQPAAPGIYRLKETGKRVENPTFVCMWTIKSPKDKGSARR